MLPDAIASFRANGKTWLVTANEGDAREYAAYAEEARIKDLPLDKLAFPDRASLRLDGNLGRLLVSTVDADTDGDGDVDALYSFGGRSLSIWDEHGALVWDSGALLEQATADAFPEHFNVDTDDSQVEKRSDAKGPEPEGVTIGKLRGRQYAFVGLERIGGVAAFDVTDPAAPSLAAYVNNRDFDYDPFAPFEEGELDPDALFFGPIGDLGPEGLLFIPARRSPIGKALLVVCNEVSGTTTIWRVDPPPKAKGKSKGKSKTSGGK